MRHTLVGHTLLDRLLLRSSTLCHAANAPFEVTALCTASGGWPSNAVNVTVTVNQTVPDSAGDGKQRTDSATATATLTVQPKPGLIVTAPTGPRVCSDADSTGTFEFQVSSNVSGTVQLTLEGFPATVNCTLDVDSPITVTGECYDHSHGALDGGKRAGSLVASHDNKAKNLII